MRVVAVLLAIAALVAIVIVGVGHLRNPVGEVPAGGFEAMRAQAEYQTSESCVACHADRYESWHRTFHRTMTQTASAESVVAPFDGRVLDFLGIRVKPGEAAGRFTLRMPDPRTGATTEFPSS